MLPCVISYWHFPGTQNHLLTCWSLDKMSNMLWHFQTHYWKEIWYFDAKFAEVICCSNNGLVPDNTLSKVMFTFCWFEHLKHTSVKFKSKYQNFLWRKCVRKCHFICLPSYYSLKVLSHCHCGLVTLWQHKTLAQVMAWYLTAPSHCLNQCCFIIIYHQWGLLSFCSRWFHKKSSWTWSATCLVRLHMSN